VNKISDEIRRRRWNWTGHSVRMERINDCSLKEKERWEEQRSHEEGQWKRNADRRSAPAGPKPGVRYKTGLVGERELRPYALPDAERTNLPNR